MSLGTDRMCPSLLWSQSMFRLPRARSYNGQIYQRGVSGSRFAKVSGCPFSHLHPAALLAWGWVRPAVSAASCSLVWCGGGRSTPVMWCDLSWIWMWATAVRSSTGSTRFAKDSTCTAWPDGPWLASLPACLVLYYVHVF